MGISEKLLSIQSELKAPKSQYNKFGNYNYRSCEDILEALKPLCKQNNAIVLLKDELVNIGERYYVRATASLVDVETGESAQTTAYAREEENKKGMDGSQITGASSTYARKYALNGLFAIDDTKDSDTTNTTSKSKNKGNQQEVDLAEQQRDYNKEIKNYAAVLAEHSKQSPDEWIAKAKEKFKTPKAQSELLLKWVLKQQNE